MKRPLIWLIRFYQKYISPRKKPCCRYYPVCSVYGLQAIERFGAVCGTKIQCSCEPVRNSLQSGFFGDSNQGDCRWENFRRRRCFSGHAMRRTLALLGRTQFAFRQDKRRMHRQAECRDSASPRFFAESKRHLYHARFRVCLLFKKQRQTRSELSSARPELV